MTPPTERDTSRREVLRERIDDDSQRRLAESLSRAPHRGDVLGDWFSFEEIFRRILATAHEELKKSSRLLMLAGFGAGLSLGFTLMARVIFSQRLGEDGHGLLGNLVYPIGFILIVLGRYQLYTENTLTPVVLVLTRLASVGNLLRLWASVFIANMAGALTVGLLLAYSPVLTEAQSALAVSIGTHAFETPWWTIFWRAVVAGHLVASMVWLVHGCQSTLARLFVVWFLMYFIGVTGMFHVITASLEVFLLAFKGYEGFGEVAWRFVLPVALGNTAGGIVFVAVVNYSLFAAYRMESANETLEERTTRLTWREWAFGAKDAALRRRNPEPNSWLGRLRVGSRRRKARENARVAERSLLP
jgi:formate/nitrite transporter FocA (FNT family)